jgi:hypothetical protein
MVQEDPSFRVETDEETNELILKTTTSQWNRIQTGKVLISGEFHTVDVRG